MLTNKQVCDRRSSSYPDFGQCSENLNVHWDRDNQAWIWEAIHDERF